MNTEDKQIEKMAKDVCPLIEEYESCEKCDAELDIEDDPCLYKCMAKAFYTAGYRKASDVAEDIVRMLRAGGITEWRYPIVADIKKKYTVGEDTQAVYKHHTPNGATYITAEPISAESEDTK